MNQLISLLLISSLSFAFGNVQFISNVDDFNLNCTIQTSAGNMVALLSTPNLSAGSFQIGRVDVSGTNASVFLLNDAIYDNIFSSTFTVDPVLKRIMVMTQIFGEKHVLIYSTLNGTLLNDIIPTSDIFMFAINLHDSTIYALTMIGGTAWLGSLDTTNGTFTPIVDTTAPSVLSPSQAIDFIRREYAFFSYDGVNMTLYRVNLDNNTVNVTTVNSSLISLSPISLHNGKFYLFVPEGSGSSLVWRLGALDVDTLEITILPLSDTINGFAALPRSFDFASFKMYTPLSNVSIINSYDMINGSQIQSSILPDGYKIEAGAFEQECICCLQQAPLSRDFILQSLSKKKNNHLMATLPDTLCEAQTSTAFGLQTNLIYFTAILMTALTLLF